jgi:hypothetical protein
MGLHQTARRQIASLLDPIGPQHEVARKKPNRESAMSAIPISRKKIIAISLVNKRNVLTQS